MSALPDEEFIQLLIKHQPVLRAFVVSLMGGVSDVEDVIQDANSKIWQMREKFVANSNFKAWMLSVARFQVLAHWRDQKRNKEWVFPDEVWDVLADEAEEFVASSDQRHQSLRECLTKLRPVDRALVLRRYLTGATLKDVAIDSGRSVDSIKVSLHRIRAVLRTCINRKQNTLNLSS